jgi:acetolactate synthase I/III small subunit
MTETMANALQHHILTVLVENKPGVLARVSTLFSRRGFNIFSLAVGPTEDDRFSRMTIVVDLEGTTLEQVIKQLNKLVNVIKITELAPQSAVERELLLVTVSTHDGLRSSIVELAAIFDAKIVDVGFDALTIMVAGAPDQLDALEELVRPYGIIELQRTGRIALPTLSREPTKLRSVKRRTA